MQKEKIQKLIKQYGRYYVARCIDKCPRDNTRKAAIKESNAYLYALNVNKLYDQR